MMSAAQLFLTLTISVTLGFCDELSQNDPFLKAISMNTLHLYMLVSEPIHIRLFKVLLCNIQINGQ